MEEVASTAPPQQYYACDVCKSKHITITGLLKHFEAVHNEQIPICAIPANSQHNSDSAKRMIPCKECSSKFISKKRLNSHLKSSHGYESDLVLDDDDDEASDGGSGAVTATPSPNPTANDDDDEESEDETLYCEVCDVHLKSRLTRHLASTRHAQNLTAKRAKVSNE